MCRKCLITDTTCATPQLNDYKLCGVSLMHLQGTWPTGIQAPLMDEGPFECLDYVYVWAAPDYSIKWVL